jgi:hypothetical protein
VARAGVDVRARRTGVRTRVLLVVRALFRVVFAVLVLLAAVLDVLTAVFFFAAAFFAVLLPFLLAWPFAARFATVRVPVARTAFLAALLRVVVRTAPFVFLRDAAAFNCFPLFGLWPRPSSRTPRNLPGPSHIQMILAEGLMANPTFFICAIQISEQADTSKLKLR